MMKKKAITINYENIPKNGKLFLRISDEIGYIKSSVGGYQSLPAGPQNQIAVP